MNFLHTDIYFDTATFGVNADGRTLVGRMRNRAEYDDAPIWEIDAKTVRLAVVIFQDFSRRILHQGVEKILCCLQWILGRDISRAGLAPFSTLSKVTVLESELALQ